MISVDTNVLVRYVTNDDPEQARRAADLLAADNAIYVPHTVLFGDGGGIAGGLSARTDRHPHRF